ncbi:MAG: LptF/LptG family permease [Halanaerobiales bacterium]
MKKKHIKLLDKYIIKEITYPFIYSVIIITIILLGNYLFQLTDLIIVKDVPIYLVLKLLLYNLPDIIVRTFPIAILFATMTGIGRLNRENELTAFRMGGVSLYRLIIPVLIIGILISGLTLYFNEQVVPWANHRAKNIIRTTVLKENMPNTREEVFFKGPKGRLFYVKEYNEENETLNNITIYNIKSDKKETKFPEVITAKRGNIKENVWVLQNGIIHEYNEEGSIILESQFNEMKFQLTEEMKEIYGNQKTTDEMSRAELAKNIKLFKESGISVHSLLVDYHLKLAQPLVAFIFVLIAVPLSLTNKESKAVNITFTIIIIFFYYLILSVCRSLGRNEILPPLLAAWLPNIIFFSLGIFILFWKESLRKLLFKFLPGLFIIFLVMFSAFSMNSVKAAEELNINSDSISYNEKLNMVRIEGNVNGKYKNIYIKSDLINIKMEGESNKLFEKAENIELLPGQITGCDFEKPHYYFDAKRVEITPGEHLKAYHVIFRELGGELPLFYWPFLYISLKDEKQNFFPRVGYNSRRGWFLKTTYTYYLDKYNLPGSLYMDYYTLSGFAGGVKQYFIKKPDHEGYVYYYQQDNNIELPNFFNWEGEVYHQYRGDYWEEEFKYLQQYYDEKNDFETQLRISNNKEERKIAADFYLDEVDYFQSNYRDIKSYGFDLSFKNEYFNSLSLDLNYEVDYDLDPEEGLTEYNGRNITATNDWGNNWETGLNYEREKRIEPDTETQTRWGGKGYISKEYGDYNYELLLERYDPLFSSEDEVAFYKAPEVTAEYEPQGNFKYKLQTGHYYEDDSNIEGERTRAEISYDNNLEIGDFNSLSLDQIFHSNFYNVTYEGEVVRPFQGVSETDLELTTRLGDHLTLKNTYQQNRYLGFSPFNFDQAEFKTLLKNQLTYKKGEKLNIKLNSGYNFETDQYSSLEMIAGFRPLKNWNIEIGTTYDLNNEVFEDNMFLTSRYKNNRINHKLGLEYELNRNKLVELDSNFSYEISGDWGWYLENNLSFDFEDDDVIKEANLQLKKNFHCREIIFSYDYLKDEYTIQYQINLFPSHGIEFIKNEDELIFDSDITEMLDQEN